VSTTTPRHRPDQPIVVRAEPDDAGSLPPPSAAGKALARARLVYEERYHDINSMLSALDGTLLVLGSQRDRLPATEVDRLIAAVREEIQSLRDVLGSSGGPVRPYDLSKLLGQLVASCSRATNLVRSEIEPGLDVQGHPEGLVAIVGNLLANAAKHAPDASVLVSAVHQSSVNGDFVEITVSDRGPGLDEDGLRHALERTSHAREKDRLATGQPGLYHCRKLAEAEGGSLDLRMTDPEAVPGRQGLTARLRLPMSQ